MSPLVKVSLLKKQCCNLHYACVSYKNRHSVVIGYGFNIPKCHLIVKMTVTNWLRFLFEWTHKFKYITW